MNILKGKDGLSKVLGFLFGFSHFAGGGGGGSEAHIVILHRAWVGTLILVRGLTNPHGNPAPGSWSLG